MALVLVDSSAWIRVEHGHLRLLDIAGDEELAVCPVVILEVLRGNRADRYEKTRALLLAATLLDAPTRFSRFEEAVQIYRQCRDAGITPSVSDCLVAACAIAHKIPLVHYHNDFVHIARVAPLQLFTRS